MTEEIYALSAKVAVLENEVLHLKAAHTQQAQHYAGMVEGLSEDQKERWGRLEEWKGEMNEALEMLQKAVGLTTDATKAQKVFFFAVLAVFSGLGWLISQIAQIIQISDKIPK